MEMADNEIGELAEALRRDFPRVEPSGDPAWSRAPAVRIIDCVLSLNRHYDRFVVPRLDSFECDHPEVTTARALRELIDSYGTPDAFCETALRYRHPERAEILSEVVDVLIAIAGDGSRETDIELLREWAVSAKPEHYRDLGIRGFGLGGFQYLRMLFGANTTKPDIHICRYVSRVLGRTVRELEALRLLEGAAISAGVVLRDLDTTIWESSARVTTRGQTSP